MDTAKTKRATAKMAAKAASPRARIARIAKGKKPQYFSDPAIDKLLWMTVTMMEELSVTRDRLDAIERLLARKRVLKIDDIERFVPNERDERERQARRSAYVDRVLRTLQAELDESVRSDAPMSEAEILAAVER